MAQRNRQRGFTLVEGLIAATVLAVAGAAVSVAISSGHMQGFEASRMQQGMMLAEEMMEYVLSLPYTDPDGASTPGPEANESTPADFDNVDDFDAYIELAGQVRDVAGVLYPEQYQVFSRSVAVQYGSETVAGFGGPIPGLLVTVTVTDNKGRQFVHTRFMPEPGS